MVAERPDRRGSHTRVFENEDGTLTLEEYLTRIHYRTGGRWEPVDNAISPDPRREGWLTTSGNAWTVAFGPTGEGVRLSSAEGSLSMLPVAAERSRGREPEIVSSPGRPEPTTAEEAIAEPAIPEPSVVRYEEVWPEVDITYEVHTGHLKEDIKILAPWARSSFPFDVVGPRLELDDDGGMRIGGALGRSFRIPPPTVFGADGSDLTRASGVHFRLPSGAPGRGQRLEVVVDRDWLSAQHRDVFPIAVDPTLSSVLATNAITINSSGLTSTSTPFRVGSQSGVHRRAAVHFSQYEQFLNQGYRVYFASVGFALREPSHDAPTTISLHDQGDPPTSFEEIGSGEAIGSFDDPASSGITWRFIEPAGPMDRWFAQDLPGQWFGIRGTESGSVNTLRRYDAFLTLDVFLPPEPSRVTNLTSDQVLATTTPTLRAQAIPASTESLAGDPMYDFQITTASAPGTGMVVSSGRMRQNTSAGQPPPSWTVPEGTLQEGITYYAWVLTDWFGNLAFHSADGPGAPPTIPPARWGVPFKVKLGLGEGGPSPTDEVGAVPGQTSTPSEGAPNPSLPPSKITANLVNGNASVAIDTPKTATVSGGIGLRFTYNSLAATSQDARGLRASFYNDANGNGAVDPGTDPLVGERIDPTVSFDLAPLQRLVAGQDPGRALAVWTGHLTLPSDKDWRIGVISSDGIRVTSGTTVLLDDVGPHAPQASPTFGSFFSPAPSMPITIEWHHSSSQRQVAQVFAQEKGTDKPDGTNTGPIYGLSPDWLTRSPKVLPPGWVLNAAATSGRWVSLADRGSSVTLFAEDGSGHEFRAVGDGSYTAPPEAPNDLLRADGEGRFVLASGGLTYTFGPTGALESLETVADDREPAALRYSYGGSPPLLRAITDPVRCADASPCPPGAEVRLSYGGDAEAPEGCSQAPISLLCHIVYLDGTATTLTYDGFGNLVRITHPGEVIYDLTYDAEGRLSRVRDPLANATIASGIRPDDETTRTRINYDGQGRVSAIIQPAPTADAPRPRRAYCYGFARAEAAPPLCQDPLANTTSVGAAGFEPATGFAQQVTYDERNRIVASTDAAGLITTYLWDDLDRLVAGIDPAGIETSRGYDSLGRVVAEHGPAPSTDFEPDGAPKPGAGVPTATTAYDGGMSGLAAAWYANPRLAGNPAYHTTSDLAESWAGACDSPSSCDGAGGLIPPSGFSGHLSGTLTQPTPGRLGLEANGGRIYVDDHLVVDQSGGPYAASVRSDRPTSWWRLSEPPGAAVAADASGLSSGSYSASGVSLGQPAPVAGDDSTAVALDGTSGSVRIPNHASLRFNRLHPFSVEAWVRTTRTTQVVIASKMANSSPIRGWEVGLDNGRPYLALVNTWGTNGIGQLATTDVADGVWHHVLVTYDGSSAASGVRFYIDGQPDAPGVTVFDNLSSPSVSPDPLYLGSRADDKFYFQGTLSDVAIYPRELSADRAAAHAAAAAVTSAASTSPVIHNTTYPQEVVGAVPIAYWRLSEPSGTAAGDSSGHHHGGYSGGVSLGVPGPVPGDPATAVAFDGTGTMSAPDAPELRFNQNEAFSVEAWVRTSSTGAQTLVSKLEAQSPHRGWELHLRNGRPGFQLINSWTSQAIHSRATTSIADGKWHHVMVTYDGSRNASGVRFFVDGRSEQVQVVVDTLRRSPVSTADIAIGSREASDFFLEGALAEVAVYPRVVGAHEVARRLVTALGPYPSGVLGDGALSYWRLGETPSSKASDLIGTSAGSFAAGCGTTAGPLVGDADGATTLDGSTCTVTADDRPGLRFDRDQPFSVEAWVRTNVSSTQMIASKLLNSSPFRGWEFGLLDGRPFLFLVRTWPSDAIAVNATTNVANGTWRHVAVTYDGSSSASGVRFFVDGQPVAGSTIHDTLSGDPRSTDPLEIGSRAADKFFFDGAISEVAVYARRLAAERIKAHHTAGVQPPPGPEPVHRIELEVQQFTSGGHLELASDAPGATFGPNSGLPTETTDADGNLTATSYTDPTAGIDARFGVPTAVTQDPGGLALTTATTYETPGPGSFLRRVAKTLPAGNQTAFANYDGDEGPIEAVCGIGPTTPQAGLPKQRTDPAPASGDARVEQYAYDARGRQVGRRVGTTSSISSADWECTSYDQQGRMTAQSWPAFDGQPARTLTYTYGVDDDPLKNEVTDTSWPGRSIWSWVDLLGRTIRYRDIFDNTTLTSYDRAGRVTDTDGPVGFRQTTYDASGRVAAEKIESRTLAEPAYDPATGRLASVDYPDDPGQGGNGTTLTTSYDDAGRRDGLSVAGPGGAITSDAATYSEAGRVSTQVIDGDASSPSSFTYDGAGRLTAADVGGHSLSYGFGTTSGCPSDAAGANTNRTSLTDNGVVTTSCYDAADRLVSTTDPRYDTVAYDDHGNTTALGDQQMTYDSADRHIATTSSGTTVTYRRDPLDRIVERRAPVGFTGASSAATGALGASSLTIPTPPGVAEGEVMVMHASAAGGSATTITPPPGWSSVATTSNSTLLASAVFWRMATASEPPDHTVGLSAVVQASGGIAAYTGVDPTDPVADSSEATATGSEVTVSGVAAAAGSHLVGLYASTTGDLTVPPTQTERWMQASPAPVTMTSAGADEAVAASGATGARTATSSTPGALVAHLLALRPAADPAVIRYGHTGHADAPAFQQDPSGAVTERTIGLPGGVLLTMTGTTPATDDVWSYPNLHGDVAATADGNGAKVGPTFTYDPFGQPLSGDPDNTGTDFSYGWVGAESKLTERAGDIHTVQMGARQYVPGLGRFLSVDPIEGGCANDYVYVFGDPVNSKDLDGQNVVSDFFTKTIPSAATCAAKVALALANPFNPSLGTAVRALGSSMVTAGASLRVLGAGVVSSGGVVLLAASASTLSAGTVVIVVGAAIVITGAVLTAKDACS